MSGETLGDWKNVPVDYLTKEKLDKVFKIIEEEGITPSRFITNPLPKGVDLKDYEIESIGLHMDGFNIKWRKK